MLNWFCIFLSIHSNLDCFVCSCCIGRRQAKLYPSWTKFGSSWAHSSWCPHNCCTSRNKNHSTCTTCDQIRYIEQCKQCGTLKSLNRMEIISYVCIFVEEHVGSVVSSVPAGVSAYSHSVIHGHSAVVHPVIQPVHKTIISHHAPILAEPIISAHHHHHAAPLLHAGPALSLAHSPLAYSHDSLSYGGGHIW